MAPRARRKTVEESAPEVTTVTEETRQEENIMADTNVVDEVVSDEVTEVPRRGRKADPMTAAMKRFKEAKAELVKSRDAKPLDEAQAEFDAAQAALRELLGA